MVTFSRASCAALLLMACAGCMTACSKPAAPTSEHSDETIHEETAVDPTATAITVSDAVVRAGAVADAPAAAFFTIHGGATPTKLQSVAGPDFDRAEMHESQMAGGVMSMSPIGAVDVPAGGTVAFRHGGKHVMIYGLKPEARQAGHVRLHLVFADGEEQDVVAPIESMGGEAMGGGAMGAMGAESGAHK